MAEGRRVDTKRPPRRWLRAILRALALSAATLGGLAVVAVIVLGVGYREAVLRDPGPHLDREHIQTIIAQESPVYYRDGTTRVGVFFEDEHRDYVPWDALPPPYVMAIVASEDGAFWHHRGIYPKHIVRAMVQNVQEGRVVAGGSTLTQQTAKNLYYRPDRSFRSKWQELLNALRLEAHFDKHEILTFYVNQFHVSGNGRGLGIAARYFFDKDVDALTTLESAFLAGLVKAPAYYDPFLGDADRRATATRRAHERTAYVLQRLLDESVDNLAGPLPSQPNATKAERQDAVRKVQMEAAHLLRDGFELKFKRGTFRYDSSAVLDEVARRLQEAPFKDVLARAGVADPATAGLVVVTTLDPDVQRESIYGLWHHLTELGAMLEARTAADFVREGERGPRYAPEHPPRRHEFRTAQVMKVIDPTGQPHFEVDLGGHVCLVDRDAVVRAAVWSYRGEKKDRNAKIPTSAVNAFAGGIPVGGVVWVSVRDVGPDGAARCDLELRPKLQGAAMVVEDGQIRAMVGGNDNRNFNRSTALRQMGSTWKPLITHAALKLGWSPLDELDNRRGVFPFSTTFYYPAPDHAAPDVVSMAWSGVHSENIASVWLLYHLTDQLGADQIRAMAESLGMARRVDESASDYRARIQKMGILPTPARVDEGFFLQARQEVLASLATLGHPDDALSLRSMHYGWGFAAEEARVASAPPSERGWKRAALDHAWVRLSTRIEPCGRQYDALSMALRRGAAPERALTPDLTVLVDEDGLRVACGAIPSGYVTPAEALREYLVGGSASGGSVGSPAPGTPNVTKPAKPNARGPRFGSLFGVFDAAPAPTTAALDLAPKGEMLIDDRVHLSTLTALESSMLRRRTTRQAIGTDAAGLYEPDVLYWHQDFRVLLGIKYVIALAAQYGVRTELREVLSLPLGASEITLEEAVSVYQGLATGQAWDFPGLSGAGGGAFDTPAAPTLLIAEIRDVDGNVLYKAQPTPREVAPAQVGDMTSDILRNVVRYGTGRRVVNLLPVGGAHIPLGGKTGTTNDYKNAAFIGFVPSARGAGYTVEDGYFVGVYVGYDDNQPMVHGNLRVAGSNGALPAWGWIAQGIAEAELLGKPLGSPEGGNWPIAHGSGLMEVSVETVSGLPVDGAGGATVLAPPPRPVQLADLDLQVRPKIFPLRRAPSTEDAKRLQELRRKAREARDRPSVWDAP